jgi:hypothetical protein
MALRFETHFDGSVTPRIELAREANRLAAAWTDAKKSREVLEREIQRESQGGMQQKLAQVSSQALVLYAALTLAYGLILFWEWSISREIYEVLIPSTTPWVPFAGCVLIALFASACLAECTSQFSVFSLQDNEVAARISPEAHQAVSELYDLPRRRNKTANWFLNPVTGLIVGLLILAGVYYASLKRVELLEAAGELPDADFQIYLPVVLYGVEILLGIPAFFYAVWVFQQRIANTSRSELTKARRQEQMLIHDAATAWEAYMNDLIAFNRTARINRKQEIDPVLPSSDLRAVLVAYYGPDGVSDERGSKIAAESNGTPSGENGAGGQTNGAKPGMKGKENREEDLLNLLDEQIEDQNRGL